MSVVQRVIVLNTPYKFRGFTVPQIISLCISSIVGYFLASKCPGDLKVMGAPIGVFVFVVCVGIGAAWGMATQMKPWPWWRNRMLYALKMRPTVYLPKREECQVYPDPTIKETPKREDQPYVKVESSQTWAGR